MHLAMSHAFASLWTSGTEGCLLHGYASPEEGVRYSVVNPEGPLTAAMCVRCVVLCLVRPLNKAKNEMWLGTFCPSGHLLHQLLSQVIISSSFYSIMLPDDQATRQGHRPAAWIFASKRAGLVARAFPVPAASVFGTVQGPSSFGAGQSFVPFPSSSGSSDGARQTVKCTNLLGGSSHANSPEAEPTSEGNSIYFPRSLDHTSVLEAVRRRGHNG